MAQSEHLNNWGNLAMVSKLSWRRVGFTKSRQR
jgi:hypothetical protein